MPAHLSSSLCEVVAGDARDGENLAIIVSGRLPTNANNRLSGHDPSEMALQHPVNQVLLKIKPITRNKVEDDPGLDGIQVQDQNRVSWMCNFRDANHVPFRDA